MPHIRWQALSPKQRRFPSFWPRRNGTCGNPRSEAKRIGDCPEDTGVVDTATQLLGPRSHGRQDDIVGGVHADGLAKWQIADPAFGRRRAELFVGDIGLVMYGPSSDGLPAVQWSG
jgi:hypothetical protein